MAKKGLYKMRAKVWLYPGMDGWHFVSLPKKTASEIREIYSGMSRGFGSLPVLVAIGQTNWKTSIFPDKPSGTYVLPLKAEVRKKENIAGGSSINFSIEIIA